MQSEIWKPIEGYKFYEVSDSGRVRSHKMSMPRIMQPKVSRKGYHGIHLSKDNKTKYFFIHRLVLEAFVGPCPSSEHQCGHLDDDKANNELENLKWVTQSENMQHDWSMGKRSHIGVRHPCAKLKEEEVWLINRLLGGNIPVRMVAEMFKVGPSTIYAILTGSRWSHVK